MSRIQKTKKGVAAIYVVVFTTMLIGIITLSFLRIMLSESGRTLNDTLSDSAYNAALAGVEDAKYVVAKYEQKIASKTKDKFTDAVETADSSNCDIIPDALKELGIEYGAGTNEQSIGSNESFQDQAYTCVTINLEGDFKGTLSENNPTLVVPLKPVGGDANVVNGVKIAWTMNENNSADSSSNFSGMGLQDVIAKSDLNGNVNNIDALKESSAVLGSRGILSDDAPTALNGLRVMLVQSPEGVLNPDYYVSGNGKTNRGTLMLLASTDGAKYFSKDELVNSADKNLNAPLAVDCDNGVCVAKIEFPKPKGETTENRNPDNFFLVLNQLYSEPSIKVTVNMLKGDVKNGDDIINFFNVQPVIDSTGRSGDLFRRVEARIGTDNGASLIPTAELSTNSDIDKSFYVTKNCIDGTTECTKKTDTAP